MPSKPNVLIVEDAPEFQMMITRSLSEYSVTVAPSAEDAANSLRQKMYDILIVDVNLPNRDGFSFVGEVRGIDDYSVVPVIFLTGRSEITDKVTAFSVGGDDYLTKPFDPLELKARVDAKLKHLERRKVVNDFTKIGNIEIDHSRHRVAVLSDGTRKEIDVTQTEFKLLCCLARRPEQVFSRDQLLVAAWGEDVRVLDRVVDTHICVLRRKLGDCGDYIKAIRGLGYKIVPPAMQSPKLS